MRRVSLTVLVLAAVTACGGEAPSPAATPSATPAATPAALPRGAEPVTLNPADFTTTIDNPYWPMKPGTRWVYRETDGKGGVQRDEMTVTTGTRTILGIEAVVVHDVVTEDGQVVEDTLDWYAQDRAGNVWYLGEDTKEYESGKVSSTKGSWEAGVGGAQAGVIMPAHPVAGQEYRQEYLKGEAEDAARVVSLTERAVVPFATYDGALLTEEVTPLEPDLRDHKFYARGVGPVLGVTVAGGAGRVELVEFAAG